VASLKPPALRRKVIKPVFSTKIGIQVFEIASGV
jgi:hypothetical protein